jgi:GAF domain-containing protein/anti-sigma regulatory factor (Ser/Thr protein kinase)
MGEARVEVRLHEGQTEVTLQALARAALELTAAGSVDEILRLVTEAARDVIGAHQGVTSRLLHGWDRATTYVSLSDRYAAWRGYDEVPKGLGVLNAVTSTNRPLRLTAEELAAHPAWRGLRDAPEHPPLPDYLAAPLVGRDGGNLGLVQLSDKGELGPFTAQDEAVLVQLAQMASNAIERLELLEREHAARLRAEALQRVGTAIAARLELQEIVQVATDAATELIPAQFGAFFYNVLDAHGESYMLYTLSGVPRSAFERFPMPRNTAIFNPTFEGEGTVRIDDVLADSRYGHSAPYHGMPEGHLPVRSYLAVPVTTATGEVVGGLFFGHPDPGVFLPEHEELVEGIAAQSAIAIENARLYDERTRTAQTLQRALLPPDLPDVPAIEVAARYRPAGRGTEVGGDFYDVFELDGGGWAIVVGDVCGKGPEAATTTALARYTLRAHAVGEHEPEALLRRLNQALLRQRAPGFCTVALACLRPDGRLDLASAGHPLPLLATADGVAPLGAVGTPLGILDDPDLETRSATLAPGDLVVLYTDGLTDAAAPARLLTEDDLAPLVAGAAATGPSAVVDALERLAVDAAGGRPRDDLAILALQAGVAARREVVRRFAADAGAAAALDEAVRAAGGDLDGRLADDLRLLAHELVSNAVRHAGVPGGTIELRVALDDDVVRVTVLDAGAGFEAPASPVGAPAGPGGWGLYLVDERASRWGSRNEGVHEVWLEVDRRG